MKSLLIIDVQNTYIEYINKKDSVLSNIEKLAKNHDNVIYLYDNISGQDLYSEIPDDWLEGYNEESFYDSFNYIIEKQYGFFRDFMDSYNLGLEVEEIIKLGKFCLKEGISDIRDINENQETLKRFNKHFLNSKITPDIFDVYSFWIPLDLCDELRSYSSFTVVGGGLNECLKEVCILLDILDIKYQIEYTCCY